MLATARVAASSPRTRKGRTAPTVQPSTIFNNSSVTEDSLTTRRTQRIVRLCGLTERRAQLVATLAFEVAHG